MYGGFKKRGFNSRGFKRMGNGRIEYGAGPGAPKTSILLIELGFLWVVGLALWLTL